MNEVIMMKIFVMQCCCEEMKYSPCPASLTKRLFNYTILANKTLTDRQGSYSPDLYWIDDNNNITYGCMCNNLSKPCIRKCCEVGKVLNGSLCVDFTTVKGSLPTLRLDKQNLDRDLWGINNFEEAFHIVQSMIVCPNGFNRIILNPEYPEDMFFLYKNGSLQRSSEQYYLPSDYCLDWTDYIYNFSAILCEDDSKNVAESTHPIGMIISILFLLITFMVYAIVPELHNLHGKTLMCHMASLIAAYTGLVIHKFDFEYLSHNNTCIFLAYMMYFSFIASFFWLNVMCFDIWWTFSGFRLSHGSFNQRENRKFIMYTIYAWGCSLILTLLCCVMETLPNIPDYIIKPEFSKDKCWFQEELAKGIYFYCPMGVTVLTNICLFISTSIKISKHKKDTTCHLKSSESRRHDDSKQWFNLYLKLFIVMGINWSMEIISWLLNDEPSWIFYITDIMNSLQGFTIFIIFVCKKKIKQLLLRRLRNGEKTRKGNFQVHYQSSTKTCTTIMPSTEKLMNN
ncbi:G-protein coupled receptor Mth2-like isoform X2 [Leptopilina boulardi]|uniref:G-protein coupled receptor Mth2-like isoform X2 n=1 Tax=Leptopilina boulardi TaxID=63433 RepID=UPI0021F68B0B|nr:G-protein coupled receptor Mth2-like isoform X2 [Leptopilina boulardi]